MSSNYIGEVGCFTADFRGKTITVGKRRHPAGFYFTNSLNEYWKDARNGENSNPDSDWLIGNRVLITHSKMWNVQEDIVAGYLDENAAENLRESIQYILRMIRRARPFRNLDMKAESERCDALFGKESVRRINRYLQERAEYAMRTDKVFSRPDTLDMKRLEKEQAHLDDYISTLDYYYNLGEDMNAALDFGKGFVKKIAGLEKRDECHLILCAMDCLEQMPFARWNFPFQNNASPSIEYLPIPKKPNSRNYVVGKRMTFTRFLDFLVVDFFEGLHAGHYPQLCENCGRYYLKTNARFQKYCTQIDPDDRLRRTCQAVAAAKGREAKERHPLRYPFINRLKTIRTHVKRGKLTEEQAAIASQIAKDRLDMAMIDAGYANTKYMIEIGQDSLYEAAGIKL